MNLQGIGQLDVDPSQRYRFNGKEFDESVGLYDYGARYYDPAVGRWAGVDPLAEQYPAWSPFNYVLGNPVGLVDPDGRSVKDIIIVNSKGIITKIIKQEGEHQVFTESGTEIKFHDPKTDQEELSIYRKGDKLIEFISEGEFEKIMNDAHAGNNDKSIIDNSFDEYDFAYSTLSSSPYNNELVEEEASVSRIDRRRTDERSKYIKHGGFYVFSSENKYKDNRRAYNIHDAGNFLWGQANKRDGWSLRKLLWGANANEWANGRLRDSGADQRAIINGYYFK